jgi:hypothetical protein
MSPAFSPTRYVISTRRKAKRELLLLPAMNDTIGQLDQPEFRPTFQRDLHRRFRVHGQPRSRSLASAQPGNRHAQSGRMAVQGCVRFLETCHTCHTPALIGLRSAQRYVATGLPHRRCDQYADRAARNRGS